MKETRTYSERKAKDPKWAADMSKRVSDTRRRNKLKLIEAKGGCCEKCGYNKCVAALEFHHPDPDAKEGGIIGTTAAYIRQKAEADKCRLLCSNCHREAHHPD